MFGHPRRVAHASLTIIAAFTLTLLAACGTSSAPTGAAATATPSPAPVCATTATSPAEYAVTSARQIVAIHDNVASPPVSSFAYPLGLPGDSSDPTSEGPGVLAVAPDGRHIALAMNIYQPFTVDSYLYILDTSTHTASRVSAVPAHTISFAWYRARIFAWEDGEHLLIFPGFGGTGQTLRYSVSTGSVAPVSGLAAATEGVVRCGTLFYLEITALTPTNHFKGQARLHRFNLATNAEVGSPVTLGDAAYPPNADAVIQSPGWDATADGSHIAYQATTIAVTPAYSFTSQFFAANADGSSRVPILSGISSVVPAWVAFSPNGALVAANSANGSGGSYQVRLCTGSEAGGDAPRCYGPTPSSYYQLDERAVWRDNTSFDTANFNPSDSTHTLINHRLDFDGVTPYLPGGDFPATNA